MKNRFLIPLVALITAAGIFGLAYLIMESQLNYYRGNPDGAAIPAFDFLLSL